jgi:TonB dependent receptor
VYTDVESEGGRNGARGPGFLQVDMRLGYRARLGTRRTLDIFGEVFNVTDRANFTNPSGDRRVPADFLRLANLQGGTGFPRQGQIGVRLGF